MKKNKLKLFLLLPLLLLTSCKQENNNISLFLYAADDEFINELTLAINQSFAGDYDLEIFSANRRQSIQNRQISSVIDSNLSNLMIVNIVDRLSSKSIIEKAATTNTPIIFINREPLLEDMLTYDKVYYVGTNPTYEGELQATIADNLFGGYQNFINSKYDKNKDGKLQVVQIKGEQGHQDTESRSYYSLNKLNNLGYQVDLLSSVFCDWTINSAYNEFRNIYNDFLDENFNSEIELLLCNNDEMAVGCINYLLTLDSYNEELSITDQYFPIIGVDASNNGLEAIRNGYLYGSVINDSEMQAEAIYKISDALLNNKDINNLDLTFEDGKFIRTNGKIVTQSTLIE